MHLLTRIERHLRRTGLSATRFGREAAGDPRFVFDLRNGRNVGPKVTARIASFLGDREKKERLHARR